ncbi:OmpA family protein [Halomonas salipaludis]|uniref:Flagellar motor protein MotB n=1 Tax=Halomonas salipaludis TaxID=2032625 RepID=A0A2A2F465_9GAMM|nr:OmpA family protein [Halomonas salipaludis]PAU79395.1 flagellar motor protein MotB [Halomonas salipaludis]
MPDTSRYDALLEEAGDAEASSGWMVSYIDVMTLLVALFVLLFALSFRLGQSDAEPVTLYTEVDATPAPYLGVPLPEEMLAAMAPQEPYLNGAAARIDPAAVVVALGVARRAPEPVAPVPARPFPAEPVMADWQPPSPQVVAANGANLEVPLEELVVVVTDTAPERSREIDPEAVAVATTLAETLEQRIAEAPHLPDLEGVEVSRVAEGISLRVEDNLLFSTAEAELTGAGRDVIESLVALIQRHDGEVSVEGHTDSRPINTPQFPSNWELSSARATAILRYLADEGVSPSRLRAVGFGDTRPLASNDSQEGRAKNRRVEVIIHL